MDAHEKPNPLIEQAAISFEEYRDCFGKPEDLMRKHLLCPMCGAHLQLTHMADRSTKLIQETARCPDCMLRVRQRIHKLM